MKKVSSLLVATILVAPMWAGESAKLKDALLGETPFEQDLRHLTDSIGGRPTGSLENLASVDWALNRLRGAGVEAWKEGFTMSELWLESSATGTITGEVGFPVRSRPEDVLHRHNASLGIDNEHLLLIMDRVSAKRAMRLLRQDNALSLEVVVDIVSSGPYESFNVLAEIPGSDLAKEVVLIGAHLDSWGLGTGALDNGCNVAMLIDIARQMRRLDLKPRRTIRFALWNGEEQGLQGSWGYVQRHAGELDHHLMASSYDIGAGRISGFFTGGRPDTAAAVESSVARLDDPESFSVLDVPVVGTDNYDFMLEGIANLVANQESSNYGPHYHASTDTFDKVDLEQVKRNAVIAATVTWAFANQDFDLPRQSRTEVEELVKNTSLGEQMRTFHMYHQWQQGKRGRSSITLQPVTARD